MTAYFDDLRREVREIPPGDGWLQALGAIESRVANEGVTGDREFPDDLREKILDTINMKAVYDLGVVPATKSAVKYALATKSSGLGGPPQHLSHARRPAHQDPVRLPLRLAAGHSEGPGQP